MLEKFIRIASSDILLPIQSLLLLAVFCIGSLFFFKKTETLKYLVAFLFISTSFDLAQWITALHAINNRFVYNFKDISEFLAISALYYFFFRNSNLKKWVVVLSVIISIVFFYFNFNWEEMAGYAVTLNRIFVAIYVIMYLHLLLSDFSIENILLHAPFWITAGFMFYSFGAIFVNLYWEYGLSASSENTISTRIELLVQIISLLLWATAIFVDKSKRIYD